MAVDENNDNSEDDKNDSDKQEGKQYIANFSL